MELGYAIYFFLVFVCGGLVLLACIVYLVIQLIIRRTAWSARSRASKLTLIAVSAISVGLLSIPARMIWCTRYSAIAGSYASRGVWGNATLEMRSDGSFTETWHFTNEDSGKPGGDGTIQGRWWSSGRDWLTRDIILQPFRPLAGYDRQQSPWSYPALVEGYSGSTAIEVDAGADIVFWK